MGGSDVTQCRLRLSFDELLIILDGEDGASGIRYLPHDNCGDIDGVAVRIVDLELVGFKVVDLDGHLLAGA
mgnify:CR=1 FL=1